MTWHVTWGGNLFGQIREILDSQRLILIFGLQNTWRTFLNPQLVLAYVYLLIKKETLAVSVRTGRTLDAGVSWCLRIPGKELSLSVAVATGRRGRKTESERQRQAESNNGKYSTWTWKCQVPGLNYFYLCYLEEGRFPEDIVPVSETSEQHLHHRDKIIQKKYVSREPCSFVGTAWAWNGFQKMWSHSLLCN